MRRLDRCRGAVAEARVVAAVRHPETSAETAEMPVIARVTASCRSDRASQSMPLATTPCGARRRGPNAATTELGEAHETSLSDLERGTRLPLAPVSSVFGCPSRARCCVGFWPVELSPTAVDCVVLQPRPLEQRSAEVAR